MLLSLQVQLQLVTATVKLFLKKPTERPQQMIQLVLTYATSETDNPDLRDRAYIYWCACQYSAQVLLSHITCMYNRVCVLVESNMAASASSLSSGSGCMGCHTTSNKQPANLS